MLKFNNPQMINVEIKELPPFVTPGLINEPYPYY